MFTQLGTYNSAKSYNLKPEKDFIKYSAPLI